MDEVWEGWDKCPREELVGCVFEVDLETIPSQYFTRGQGKTELSVVVYAPGLEYFLKRSEGSVIQWHKREMDGFQRPPHRLTYRGYIG
jgi:hypothetical protein